MIEILISSSVLIALVCLLRLCLRGRISPCLQYGLWGIVALRLVMPWFYPVQQLAGLWSSRFSVMNAAKAVGERAVAGTELEFLADNLATGHVYRFDPAEASLVEKAAGIDWQLWIMAVWVAGSLILAGWMLYVNLRFTRELEKWRRPYAGSLPGFVSRPVWVAPGLASPCYVGLHGHEAIYLPEEVAEDEEKTRHALAHETGHVAHGDRMWGILRCALLCYYWVNPLVWAAAVLSKRDCELACDEAAVKLLGEKERYAYGKTLVSLIAGQSMKDTLFSAATTMAAGKRTVRERVRILARAPRTTGVMLAAVCAAAAALVACTYSGAEQAAGASGALTTEERFAETAGSGDGAEEDHGGSDGSGAAAPGETEAPSAERRLSVEGQAAAQPVSSGDGFEEFDGSALQNPLRPVGENDTLELLKEEQWGNYYRLTFQRRDKETGEGLSVRFSYRPEEESGLELTVVSSLEGGASATANPRMGWGMSRSNSDSSVFSVDFWNVENAEGITIALNDGENAVTYLYRPVDEEPVESYDTRQIIGGAENTGVSLRHVTVYPNAVWLSLSGSTVEEAEDFTRENSLLLELDDGQICHPATGGRDGALMEYLYTFQEELFPGPGIHSVVTGRGNMQNRPRSLIGDLDLEKTVRTFVEAYMDGDLKTAGTCSSVPDLESRERIERAAGENGGLLQIYDDEAGKGKASAAYRFIAEGETDSYTYLAMEAEKADGVWMIVDFGYEK